MHGSISVLPINLATHMFTVACQSSLKSDSVLSPAIVFFFMNVLAITLHFYTHFSKDYLFLQKCLLGFCLVLHLIYTSI